MLSMSKRSEKSRRSNVKNDRPSTAVEEFDLDRLRYFMSLSTEEKLNHLEQLNAFFAATMPEQSKAIWERLRAEGF